MVGIGEMTEIGDTGESGEMAEMKNTEEISDADQFGRGTLYGDVHDVTF
jgi:hypothetical protein